MTTRRCAFSVCTLTSASQAPDVLLTSLARRVAFSARRVVVSVFCARSLSFTARSVMISSCNVVFLACSIAASALRTACRRAFSASTPAARVRVLVSHVLSATRRASSPVRPHPASCTSCPARPAPGACSPPPGALSPAPAACAPSRGACSGLRAGGCLARGGRRCARRAQRGCARGSRVRGEGARGAAGRVRSSVRVHGVAGAGAGGRRFEGPGCGAVDWGRTLTQGSSRAGDQVQAVGREIRRGGRGRGVTGGEVCWM
ncbi:hypothetical protein B0H10DRAFT_1355989 [Mycena sp. CBHHK59/15]|nr:hypothetical protein B0H10DRAFT_1355989 [Mycena sp. CBHHK59/15]